MSQHSWRQSLVSPQTTISRVELIAPGLFGLLFDEQSAAALVEFQDLVNAGDGGFVLQVRELRLHPIGPLANQRHVDHGIVVSCGSGWSPDCSSVVGVGGTSGQRGPPRKSCTIRQTASTSPTAVT